MSPEDKQHREKNKSVKTVKNKSGGRKKKFLYKRKTKFCAWAEKNVKCFQFFCVCLADCKDRGKGTTIVNSLDKEPPVTD